MDYRIYPSTVSLDSRKSSTAVRLPGLGQGGEWMVMVVLESESGGGDVAFVEILTG